MTLKIISARQIEFQGEVELVTLPGTNGSFTVLNHHASLLSTLTAGNIEYEAGGKREIVPVTGGIVDVDNNVVSVCVY